MRYRIVFRPITAQDLDRNCLTVPNEHEYEGGMLTVIHNASLIDGVTEVHRDGDSAVIVSTHSTLDDVKTSFAPLLRNNWGRLRVDFQQIE